MSRVVIIGESVGGVKTAQAFRVAGHMGEIVLVEAEAVLHPYDKQPLSKSYLDPAKEISSIALVTEDDLAAVEARTIFGVTAIGLDPLKKALMLADDESVAYDSPVVASARAQPLPCGVKARECICCGPVPMQRGCISCLDTPSRRSTGTRMVCSMSSSPMVIGYWPNPYWSASEPRSKPTGARVQVLC